MAKFVWDSSRQELANELLERGDYDFKVIDCEDGFITGGKTSGSQYFKIKIGIGDQQGKLRTVFTDMLILSENTAWKVQSFLVCVNFNDGKLEDGDEIDLYSAAIVGHRGRARIGIRDYQVKKDDGSVEDRKINEVVKYLDEKKYPRDIELAKKKFPDFFGPAGDDEKIPF